MGLLRTFTPLTLAILLTACSGGDAPVAPKLANAAQSAPVADSAAPPPAPASAPTSAPAPDTTLSAADPGATPATTPPPAATTPATSAPAAPTASPAPAAADGAPQYQVQCAAGAAAAEQCQVDKDTYIGWRTFSSQCQVCHGGSALGSTFAPNLLDRFHQRVDHARFIEVVTNGFRGQVGAMPAWKGNPNVMPHVDQLYRYLKARADGALPPGRPERLP